jgi:beta-RFAP synthase
MSRFRIVSPSRLHFGLLAWGPHSPRQFGGVGLMIEAPRLELTAAPAATWQADGLLPGRTLAIAAEVARRLADVGLPVVAARLVVEHAPAEHVGLGLGTQLSLAVARALCAVSRLPDPSIAQLAALTGRGQRSGIGLHGFVHGGLIIDGGRRGPEGWPPLLARLDFPQEWAVLVVQPPTFRGLHGTAEMRAFAELPPITDRVTDRLCRLVLLGLLPALIERDIESFGAALTELQRRVGHCFAPAQGGIYARPELETIVNDLRGQGLHGAGQSSWGPTLYAFSAHPPEARATILEQTRSRCGLAGDALYWTRACPEGSRLEPID